MEEKPLKMGKLSNKERMALESFREKITDVTDEWEDYFKHDLNLMRYLRARDLNVAKAEEMLRKSMQWREDNQVDSIRHRKLSPYMRDNFPFYLTGYDAEGCYVNIVPIGQYNYKKAIDEGFKDEIRDYTIYCGEKAFDLLKYKTKHSGKYVNQAVAISDWEHFSVRQFMSPDVLQMMKEMTVMMESNYPELVKVAIVVNAPTVFEVLFNLIKPLLSKATIAKVRIYGSNTHTWREELRKLIPADNLPSKYGGSNTSCTFYKVGSGMDLTPKLITLEESDMSTEAVAAGQKFTVTVHVANSSCQLCWNFKTEHHDIGFSLHREDSPEEKIFEVPKCDSHLVLQKGVLNSPEPGDYVLTFDNSFSMFRAKSLSYIVKVLES